MYIAPGQWQTAPRGHSFDVNFIHLLQVLKKISLKSDFIYFFQDLIHVYSPGAGTDSPQGTKFSCQQKGLTTLPIFFTSFKELSLKSDLIHFFS